MVGRFIFRTLAVLALLVIIGVAVVFFILAPKIPRLPDDLRLLATAPATQVFGRDGELIGSLGGRTYVSLDRISPYFPNAVVAVEDRRFRSHRGIDRLAMARALWQNAVSLGSAPGGSSITQQLAKNLFFPLKRSWTRKILEAMAAVAIEDRFTKDQILEAYCNLIDFGQYAFGVETASQVYFGKHAADLQLHEAALLAAVLNAPSRYNPFTHLDAAKGRQKQVLEAMARAGTIPPDAVEKETVRKLRIVRSDAVTRRGSFPVDWALEWAGEDVGYEAIAYGGVRIYTTIDPFLQKLAEKTLTVGMDDLEARLKPLASGETTRLEGALVALDVPTGRVLAVVGGRNWAASSYNRATKALRQPGSSFKPIVYLTALEKGDVSPVTVMVDQPLKLKIDRNRTWSPVNFDGDFRGPLTLKLALMKSINTVTAQLIDKTGPEAVVKTAHKLGIMTPLEPHLSLGLGAQGIPPLELASAYAAIAREGVEIQPLFVARVEDRSGNLLKERMTAEESRFSPETVYQLIDMLKGVLEPGGTGEVVRRRGFSGIAFGKTGTSSDYRDAWFAGATTRISVVVWVGYDDNRQMRLANGVGVTGAAGAAFIWADFMVQATAGQPVDDFAQPDGVARFYVEPIRGVVSPDSMPGWLPVMLTPAQAAQAPRDSSELDEQQ